MSKLVFVAVVFAMLNACTSSENEDSPVIKDITGLSQDGNSYLSTDMASADDVEGSAYEYNDTAEGAIAETTTKPMPATNTTAYVPWPLAIISTSTAPSTTRAPRTNRAGKVISAKRRRERKRARRVEARKSTSGQIVTAANATQANATSSNATDAIVSSTLQPRTNRAGKVITRERRPVGQRGKNRQSPGNNKMNDKTRGRLGRGRKTLSATPRTQDKQKRQSTTKSPTRSSVSQDQWLNGTCSVSCGKFHDFKDTFDARLTTLTMRMSQVVQQNRELKASMDALRAENQQLRDQQHGTVRKLEEVFKRLHDLERTKEEIPKITNARRWGAWDDWTPCSVTCGEGTMSRNRTCEGDPSWVDQCKGKDQEVKKCKAKSKCRNITLSCNVEFGGKCFMLQQKRASREGHAIRCKNGNGSLANIYSDIHLNIVKKLIVENGVTGRYIWTGMTYDVDKKQLLLSDGNKGEFAQWMHEFGAAKKPSMTGITLHFDPHEEFRKENGFHVMNGFKNEIPSTVYSFSLCEFAKSQGDE